MGEASQGFFRVRATGCATIEPCIMIWSLMFIGNMWFHLASIVRLHPYSLIQIRNGPVKPLYANLALLAGWSHALSQTSFPWASNLKEYQTLQREAYDGLAFNPSHKPALVLMTTGS